MRNAEDTEKHGASGAERGSARATLRNFSCGPIGQGAWRKRSVRGQREVARVVSSESPEPPAERVAGLQLGNSSLAADTRSKVEKIEYSKR